MCIKIIKHPQILKIFIFALINFSAYANESLIFAIDIIRHGDRTPTVKIPNDPHTWQEGLGELTSVGMRQEFNLGKTLRDKYILKHKFLSKKYCSNTIYVRSTDFDRTLMSAQSVLLGLYPLGTGSVISGTESPALPQRYQPIPVHTIPITQDSMLIPGQNQPEFHTLLAKYVFSSPQWQEKSNKYKTKLKRWSMVTGLHIESLYQIIPLGDNLYIRSLYDIPMPKGITNSDKNEIISLTNWVAQTIYQPYEVSSYVSKGLRVTIAAYLLSAIKSSSELKYVLFSSHDSTLMAIMSALHQPLQSIPPYASELRILLFKESMNKDYYVKLTFNESDLSLKECPNKCTLTDFLKLLR